MHLFSQNIFIPENVVIALGRESVLNSVLTLMLSYIGFTVDIPTFSSPKYKLWIRF